MIVSPVGVKEACINVYSSKVRQEWKSTCPITMIFLVLHIFQCSLLSLDILNIKQLKAHIKNLIAMPVRNAPGFRMRLQNEMLLRTGQYHKVSTQWILWLILNRCLTEQRIRLGLFKVLPSLRLLKWPLLAEDRLDLGAKALTWYYSISFTACYIQVKLPRPDSRPPGHRTLGHGLREETSPPTFTPHLPDVENTYS